MTLDIQFKLKSNPMYKQYLRENSYWYKILTRHPEEFKNFEESAKHYFKMTPADKIGRVLETVELLGSFMSALK